MSRLAATLETSHVILNIASTITLEAAVFKTPVINLAFDLKPEGNEYAGSISRYYRYTHYAQVIKSKAAFLAEDLETLIVQITALLGTEKQFSKNERTVSDFCEYTDAKSSLRAAKFIVAAIEKTDAYLRV